MIWNYALKSKFSGDKQVKAALIRLGSGKIRLRLRGQHYPSAQ